MRQEHKFCAEVYHFLYDFIDHDKPVYFCLDGIAARNSDEFADSTVPDFLFTFCGGSEPFLIEAKILDARGMMTFDGKSRQSEQWSPSSNCRHKPHLWIATNSNMTSFWLWRHDCFAQQLAKRADAKKVKAPDEKEEHSDVKSLALGILEFAKRNGFVSSQGGVR